MCVAFVDLTPDTWGPSLSDAVAAAAAKLVSRPGPDGESDELTARRTTSKTVTLALRELAADMAASPPRGHRREAARLAGLLSSGHFAAALRAAYDTAPAGGRLSDARDALRLTGIDSEVLLDALVRHEAGRHLGLVRHQANRVASKYPGYEPEALFGMGWAGLIVALYKYDPTTSAFSTFAAIKIRGNIADSVRSESPIPKRLHTWYRKVSTAFEELTSNLERRPTLEEVATELATTRLTRDLGRVPSLEEVASQLDAERQRMSILPRLSVPEALPADDAFGDRHFDEPESTAVLSGLQHDVWAALRELDPLEAAVIERVELRSRPIDEVAGELGVTPRQVRTLRENGRARLAVALADWAPAAV